MRVIGKNPRKRDRVKEFLDAWREAGHPIGDLCTEHAFHPLRTWRFDIAWPSIKVAVEIHGGGFGHQSSAGRRADYEKWNAAAFMGWKLFHMETQNMFAAARLERVQTNIAETMGGMPYDPTDDMKEFS